MIHGFPIPYPDEMFYSVVARRDAQMGYPSYKGLLREVFGCEGTVVAFEFPSHLGHLLAALPESHPCADFKRLERLTLLPWYAPFIPLERSDRIREVMRERGGREIWNWAGATASRVKTPKVLRYCPECLRADKEAGRTLYWRRLHQIAGIDVCPTHGVFLEDSGLHRLKRKYRYHLPDEGLLNAPARPVKPSAGRLVDLAKLGEELLSREWPTLDLARLRQNYLLQLDRMGYVDVRGEVKMEALLLDLRSFYGREFLERLGCRGPHWVARMLRASDSIQQPIRHLMLLNYMGLNLDDLFAPKPLPQVGEYVPPTNLRCVNHLCPDHGKATSKYEGEERSSMLGGAVETYSCDTCGQVQARCCVGHERTWVRDRGQLWRERLAELWADPSLGLRAIARELRASCDAVRKQALKLGLPLKRFGRRALSVRSYPHLLGAKDEKRRRKVARARARWLEAKQNHPDLGTRGLRQKLPAVYASLCRYDREWLDANKPARKQRALKVDWKVRDLALSRELKSAASRLPELTPTQLAREVGVAGWISDRLAMLPQSQKVLAKLVEASRN